MIGQTISHYKILEKLGEGGMGVVYKAEDTKLRRVVALKFLPQQLTANQAERARFLQEAQAAATLNHPNVCTIYRVDEFESQQFIEMEYVDGGTMRSKLPVQKTEEALSYAVQIGEALIEAHSKGIVHRDIVTAGADQNSTWEIQEERGLKNGDWIAFPARGFWRSPPFSSRKSVPVPVSLDS